MMPAKDDMSGFARVTARIRLSDLKMLSRVIARFEAEHRNDAKLPGDALYTSDEAQAVKRLRQLVTTTEKEING
jgi:hypothetical protein